MEGIPQPAFCEAQIVHTAKLERQGRLAPPTSYSVLFQKAGKYTYIKHRHVKYLASWSQICNLAPCFQSLWLCWPKCWPKIALSSCSFTLCNSFSLFSNKEKFRYPILGGFVQTAHLSDYRVVMLHTFAQEAHYKGGWSDDAWRRGFIYLMICNVIALHYLPVPWKVTGKIAMQCNDIPTNCAQCILPERCAQFIGMTLHCIAIFIVTFHGIGN